ncbi:M15 family metallopeptidase [Promicromonospora sukumoe]|uniref:M15 family metallopeptidase n=1 Tax=Promicromonospora sukumoe TaxID=88382 RepID=UPI0012F826AE|nr:M15 family metallopeptidase [Promicromonospora sukumoe]
MTIFLDRQPLPRIAVVMLAVAFLLTGCASGAAPATYETSASSGLETGFGGSAADGAAADGAAADGAAADGEAVAGASADEPVGVPAEATPGIDLAAHSPTDPASPWVVVNKRVAVDPVDYEPDLTTVRGYLVRPDVAPDLTALLAAAEADGVHLTLRSAYRGYSKQAAVYEGWVAQLGSAQADAVSARPGHSEHQTGLAVDVGGSSRPQCDFEPCFGDTPEGRWVAEHARSFGFLVRYTPENKAVTGYAPEAWHLRWVGRDLAGYLSETGLSTLEEVFDVPGGDYRR